MSSFLGRDILSLKDFERQDFMRVFQLAEELEPYARDRHKTEARVIIRMTQHYNNLMAKIPALGINPVVFPKSNTKPKK